MCEEDQPVSQATVNELNLAEILVGLNRADWDAAIDTMREFGAEFVSTTAKQVAAARLDSGLRLPDACVLATARAVGADTLLTFGQALRTAARADGYKVD